jgi:hypothetical protein
MATDDLCDDPDVLSLAWVRHLYARDDDPFRRPVTLAEIEGVRRGIPSGGLTEGNSTVAGETVQGLFGGSGSALMRAPCVGCGHPAHAPEPCCIVVGIYPWRRDLCTVPCGCRLGATPVWTGG